MAKLGGGLFRLDAICAKLKQNKLASNSKPNECDTSSNTKDQETNNNVSQEQEARADSPVERNSKEATQDSPIKDNDDEEEEQTSLNNSGEQGEDTETLAADNGAKNGEPVTCSPEQGLATPSGPEGTSRRSRRKNQKPRSIVHLQNTTEILKETEEIEDFVMNNEDVDLEQQYQDEEEDAVLDLSGGNKNSEQNRDNTDDNSAFSTDDFGAIDLSVGKSDSRHSPSMQDKDDMSSQASDLSSSAGSNKPFTQSTKGGSQASNKTQGINPSEAAEIKNYAENTMNELLSMYGLEDDDEEGPSIASNLPLQHFRSMLERHGSSAVPNSINAALKAKLAPKIAHAQQGMPGFTQGYSAAASSSHRLASSSNSNSPLPPSVSDLDNEQLGVNSSAFIKNFDPSAASQVGALSVGGKALLPNYGKYVKKFSSFEQCGGNHCKDMGYKEHFHCLDCNFKVFVKKEDMIRHFKWHKKRDESLQHGFMRYSPMDDCSKKFPPCTHNGRQTHYHCLQPGCTKVYISTSDVQMHANYHRKDSAIIQEGFQRFRATEDCGTVECSFYGQRTTHFHCRRPGCKFTFKNKADMEKHKTYHQKDEILAKDGFKKFMKYEHCSFQGCRYSKVSNHIHCIRSGCDYVLHSTGQLFSHKRKHERRDFEHAYKRFKNDQKQKAVVNPAIRPMLAQHMAAQIQVQQLSQQSGPSMATAPPGALSKDKEYVDLEDLAQFNQPSSPDDDSEMDKFDLPVANPGMYSKPPPGLIEIKPEGTGKPQASTLAKLASKLQGGNLGDSLNLTIPGDIKKEPVPEPVLEKKVPVQNVNAANGGLVPGMNGMTFVRKVSPAVNEKRERDESWKKYLTRYTANDPCHSRCQFLYKDHYHCSVHRCNMLFKSKDGVREHAKHHEQQDRITTLSFMTCEEGVPCVGCQHSKIRKHYHCLWPDCKQVVTDEDPVFNRLEHHKIHEFARNSMGRKSMNTMVPRSPETFKRKRGRPPKYPKNVIPVVPKMEITDEEISEQAMSHPGDIVIGNGFCRFGAGEPCPDDKCMYFLKEHFHCLRLRCHHATDRTDMLNLHAKDFHSYINIMEGFEFFDRNVNCRRPHCHNNRANRHFHCVKPKCDYSFVRYSTMGQHDKKHKMAEMGLTPSPSIAIPRMAVPGMPGQSPAASAASPQQAVNLADKNSVVKAAGTYFPMSTLPKGAAPMLVTSSEGTIQVTNNPPVMVTISSGASQIPGALQPVSPIVIAPVTSPTNLVSIAPKPADSKDRPGERPPPNALPLSALLQQKTANIPQLNWLTMKMKMHYGVLQNCGRPFCKLKKKDHYHCYDCNQAFSDPVRLKSHVTKHGIKLDSGDQIDHQAGSVQQVPEMQYSTESDDDAGNGDELNPNSSLNLNPQAFTNMMQKGQQQEMVEDKSDSDEGDLVMDLSSQVQEDDEKEADDSNGSSLPAMEGVDEGPIVEDEPEPETPTREEPAQESQDGTNPARRSSRKRTATKHDDFVDSDAALSKIRRISSPRSSKDDSTPEGYTKHKFNEDCGYERCAYRQNMTHFHCNRKDCANSFNDRSRLPQHNEKHKRLDDLMGEEFQQFSLKIACGRADCEHARKASHFHCVLCTYNCTDTNKVTAHRRHHAKLKDISAQGFAKYTAGEACNRDKCSHSQKQTHYHCTQEGCAVVAMGPAQINAHALKHQNN